MNGFGHDAKRPFAVKERLQFVTSPTIARRVRAEAKKLKLSRGDFIEMIIKHYFEKIDASLEIEKRNEFFKEFESEK